MARTTDRKTKPRRADPRVHDLARTVYEPDEHKIIGHVVERRERL